MLNLWSGRRLSILGRIAIVKTLALSKLVYNCSVLDTPTDFAKEVNKVIFPFIWNFKPDKINRNTLTGPISKGGLNMVNFSLTSDRCRLNVSIVLSLVTAASLT